MKVLKNLEDREILTFVMNSKKLSELFENTIRESESDFLEEKINCFDYASYNANIEFYESNFLTVKDYGLFFQGIEKSIFSFCCSDSLQKDFNHVKKLYLKDSNLFPFYCEKLAQKYFKEEILLIIQDFERICMYFYNKEINASLLDYLDLFIDNGYLDNVYINSENKLVELSYL